MQFVSSLGIAHFVPGESFFNGSSVSVCTCIHVKRQIADIVSHVSNIK